MAADVHLLRSFESYETDTSAPRTLFLSPMQVSQARAERLILGEETFKIVSEPGISEHAPGSFMLRAYVKTGRRLEKKQRVASNTMFDTGRFDGGENYTNRLAAAQAAPRFKLWLECGKPSWEEFHRGLSDAAKAELKRQGWRARNAEERRMYEEGRRLEFLVKKGSDSITRADKWEHKANTLADLAKQCHDGVKQIAAWETKQETQLDNKPKLIEMLEGEEERGRAYIERMQKKLLMQAMVCGQYFHILANRDMQKAQHFRNRAALIRRASTELKRRRESDANADAVNADDDADARDADVHVLDMFDELDQADPTKGRDVHAIADERRTKTRDAARARRRADERGVWEERHRERGRGDVKRRTRSFQALAHEHDDAKEGDFYAARPGGEKGANVRVRRHGVRLFTHRSRARVRRVRRIISTIDAFRVRRDVLPKFHRH